jgi:hypothetical protein
MPMHTLQSTSFRLPAKCHYHNHKSGDLQLTTAAVLLTLPTGLLVFSLSYGFEGFYEKVENII